MVGDCVMSGPEGVCTRARVRVRARARKNAHLDNFKTGGRFGLKLSQMIGYVEGSWSMACAHVHVRAKRAKTRIWITLKRLDRLG